MLSVILFFWRQWWRSKKKSCGILSERAGFESQWRPGFESWLFLFQMSSIYIPWMLSIFLINKVN